MSSARQGGEIYRHKYGCYTYSIALDKLCVLWGDTCTSGSLLTWCLKLTGEIHRT